MSRHNARLLIGAAISLLLVVFVALTANEAKAETPSTYMIGDSMTAWSEDSIRSDWRVNAVRGRHAVKMRPLIRRHVNSNAGPADQVVIALGSNGHNFTRARYRRTINMLPRSTKIVLVTTYRDPKVFGAHRAARMAKISKWKRTFAKRRGNVCVAEWRGAAMKHGDAILADGVHPNPKGQRIFARRVARAMNNC